MHEGFVNFNAGHAGQLDGRGPDLGGRGGRRRFRHRRRRVDHGHAVRWRHPGHLGRQAVLARRQRRAAASRSATTASSRRASTSPPGTKVQTARRRDGQGARPLGRQQPPVPPQFGVRVRSRSSSATARASRSTKPCTPTESGRTPGVQPGLAPARISGEESVRSRRPPRPGFVSHNRGWCVEQRLHDAPGLLDAVFPSELAGVAAHRVAQEAFIGFRRFAEFLGEDQRQVHRARAVGAWLFCLHDQVGTGIGSIRSTSSSGSGACGVIGSLGGRLKMTRISVARTGRVCRREGRTEHPTSASCRSPAAVRRTSRSAIRLHPFDGLVSGVLAAHVMRRVRRGNRAEHLRPFVARAVGAGEAAVSAANNPISCSRWF